MWHRFTTGIFSLARNPAVFIVWHHPPPRRLTSWRPLIRSRSAAADKYGHARSTFKGMVSTVRVLVLVHYAYDPRYSYLRTCTSTVAIRGHDAPTPVPNDPCGRASASIIPSIGILALTGSGDYDRARAHELISRDESLVASIIMPS